jgi:DNA ligase-1
MTIEGTPNFKVWIFDYVNPNGEEISPFYIRMLQIPDINAPKKCFELSILHGVSIENQEELDNYERICLEAGYEGVMLRDPMGTYKFGRSTVNDNILLKVKRFLDDEAKLIEIQEKMSNQNPEELDAFGHIKRSASLDGMIATGVAGTLIVQDKDGNTFGIGSGLNDLMREEIWNNKEKYIGKLVKYKYFPQGVKELPRHPVFLGFRDSEDL